MRVLQGILPHRVAVARRKFVHPPVNHIIFFRDLKVFRLPDGGEIGPGAGDMPLVTVVIVIDQLRKHVPTIEPVGLTSKEGKGLRIARDPRFDQALGEPSSGVIGLFASERKVVWKSKYVAIGHAAGFDAIDQ